MPARYGVLVLLVLSGCFMPASIQNRVNQREMERVQAAAAEEWRAWDQRMAERGWRPVGEPLAGRLQERYDESDEVRMTLPSNGTYAVVGICGGNCIDMDLVVWNAARRRVGADTEPDARPIATFRGTAGERVTVGVTIPDCRRPARNPRLDEEPMWDCIYYTRLYRQG